MQTPIKHFRQEYANRHGHGIAGCDDPMTQTGLPDCVFHVFSPVMQQGRSNHFAASTLSSLTAWAKRLRRVPLRFGGSLAAAAAALLWCLAPACSTEIDLNADFVETPVLFGVLDQTQDTQYIRINRAFLKDGENALLLATDPNEIYYDERMSARLERYDNGTFVGSTPLLRVDGDSLGRKKQSGTFATSPNILYRFVDDLDPELDYRVVADAPELGFNIQAQTNLIQDFVITRPNPNPTLTSALSFTSFAPFLVRWSNGIGAKIYELEVYFFVREEDANDLGTTILDTVLTWQVFTGELAPDPNSGSGLEYQIPRASFYSFLANAVDPKPGVVRFIDSVQFSFIAGNELLYNYILFSNTQLGITADQVSAVYTNVEGQGLGLLASRFRRLTPKYKLSNQTLDTIACGPVTGGLGYAASGESPVFPFCP
jgi:hypothetical protein